MRKQKESKVQTLFCICNNFMAREERFEPSLVNLTIKERGHRPSSTCHNLRALAVVYYTPCLVDKNELIIKLDLAVATKM